MTVPVCPYCGQPSNLADSAEVYNGRSYGPIYLCRPCRAWVGCHKGTTQALGRLADEPLRKAKRAAHESFDPIWQRGRMSRSAAYSWLADRLGIPVSECHIGMFDLDVCKRVVEVCREAQVSTVDT